MWLPAPIYERIPQLWFFLGLLFITYGIYVGLDIANSLLYVGSGIVCCGIGAAVASLRVRRRNKRSNHADSNLNSH